MQSSSGAALVSITVDSDNVQISNFESNSFTILNTGGKKISKIEIDVTEALYAGSVFDPFGQAGDTVSKALTIDSPGNTGIILPSNYNPYVGLGGINGYTGLILGFDENVNGGFEPGESIGFSIDMDPNSIAEANKSQLDAGTIPTWDVGGVSGAELIGSQIKVTFSDETTATSQLQGIGNQAGAQALISQDSPNLSASLRVNGVTPGNVGFYNSDGPNVVVDGPAGQTARVVLTKGFIQPVSTNQFTNPYKVQLDSQLSLLASSSFPANNAVEFQTIDVLLTGEPQNLSSMFNFSEVELYSFAGEDQLPLGFVASIVDTQNDGVTLGPVTKPIYSIYSERFPSLPISLAWNTETGVVSTFSIDVETSTASQAPIGRKIADTNWRLQTTGDLNGDGQDDVLLRNFAAGINLAWYMTPGGEAIQSERVIGRTVEDPNWSIVGTGDLDGDGNTDIVLRNETADQLLAWYMDGSGNIKSEGLIGRSFNDNNWKVEALADFNGDSKVDIVLRHRLSGQNLLWEMNGSEIIAESLLGRDIPDANWHIEGARDFDNDGITDLFLRHQGVGQGLLWKMADKNTINSEVVIENVPTGTTQIIF